MAPPTEWDLAFEFTMNEEGVKRDAAGQVLSSGLNTTPGDPGGTTNFGFAQRYHPDIDVTKLTWDTAKARAYEKYWVPVGCDKLLWPTSLIVFDTCFNQSFQEAHALLFANDWEDQLWARLSQYAHKHPINLNFTRWWLVRVLHLRSYIQEHPHV